MTETIPNPLTDKGVRDDINTRVKEIMDRPLTIGGLESIIRNAITRAAEWGYSEGFRMGWRIRDNRQNKG